MLNIEQFFSYLQKSGCESFLVPDGDQDFQAFLTQLTAFEVNNPQSLETTSLGGDFSAVLTDLKRRMGAGYLKDSMSSDNREDPGKGKSPSEARLVFSVLQEYLYLSYEIFKRRAQVKLDVTTRLRELDSRLQIVERNNVEPTLNAYVAFLEAVWVRVETEFQALFPLPVLLKHFGNPDKMHETAQGSTDENWARNRVFNAHCLILLLFSVSSPTEDDVTREEQSAADLYMDGNPDAGYVPGLVDGVVEKLALEALIKKFAGQGFRFLEGPAFFNAVDATLTDLDEKQLFISFYDEVKSVAAARLAATLAVVKQNFFKGKNPIPPSATRFEEILSQAGDLDATVNPAVGKDATLADIIPVLKAGPVQLFLDNCGPVIKPYQCLVAFMQCVLGASSLAEVVEKIGSMGLFDENSCDASTTHAQLLLCATTDALLEKDSQPEFTPATIRQVLLLGERGIDTIKGRNGAIAPARGYLWGHFLHHLEWVDAIFEKTFKGQFLHPQNPLVSDLVSGSEFITSMRATASEFEAAQLFPKLVASMRACADEKQAECQSQLRERALIAQASVPKDLEGRLELLSASMDRFARRVEGKLEAQSAKMTAIEGRKSRLFEALAAHKKAKAAAEKRAQQRSAQAPRTASSARHARKDATPGGPGATDDGTTCTIS